MQYVLIHPTTTLLIISYQQIKVIGVDLISANQNNKGGFHINKSKQ